jgi:hypothetical protein
MLSLKKDLSESERKDQSLSRRSVFPIDDGVSVCYTVLAPVETHVDSFGATLGNGVVGDADSARITSFVRSGWLRMAQHVVLRSMVPSFPLRKAEPRVQLRRLRILQWS